MRKPPKSIDTAQLPQYGHSLAFMERFLLAIHDAGTEITRSPNDKTIKLVDGREMSADALDYFEDGKADMEVEFLADLSTVIGGTNALKFCEIVATEWTDGRKNRNGTNVRRLKRSVYNYLLMVTNDSTSISKIVTTADYLQDVEPLLSEKDTAAILTLNDQMMYRHIEAWKLRHPYCDQLSNDDIFLRRGLALSKDLDVSDPYIEWDFMNSYSLALSAPEQFSQMTSGGIPAILNGDIDLFKGRILFFAPFIRGMTIGQLEVGIIPALKPLPIRSAGIHGGIHEYNIDPAPFQLP